MENYYENADSKCPFAANTQGDCNLKYVDFFLAICTNEYWRMYSSQVRRFAKIEEKYKLFVLALHRQINLIQIWSAPDKASFFQFKSETISKVNCAGQEFEYKRILSLKIRPEIPGNTDF